MLQEIKDYGNNSKKYNFNGKQFSTNNDGMIIWSNDWTVAAELKAAGLVTHTSHNNKWAPIDYYLN